MIGLVSPGVIADEPVLPKAKALPPRVPPDSHALAYLAGIVDGEGSIVGHVAAGNITVSLLVSNTSTALVQWLYATVGGTYWRMADRNPTGGPSKPMYRWFAGGQAALSIIAAIEPWLVIKRKQAICADRLGCAWHRRDMAAVRTHLNHLRALNGWGRRKGPHLSSSPARRSSNGHAHGARPLGRRSIRG